MPIAFPWCSKHLLFNNVDEVKLLIWIGADLLYGVGVGHRSGFKTASACNEGMDRRASDLFLVQSLIRLFRVIWSSDEAHLVDA